MPQAGWLIELPRALRPPIADQPRRMAPGAQV